MMYRNQDWWRRFYLECRQFYLQWKWFCVRSWKQVWLFISFRPKELCHRLWIRKDEFHSSLDLDSRAMMLMTDKQCEKYIMRISRARMIAHERDLDAEVIEKVKA